MNMKKISAWSLYMVPEVMGRDGDPAAPYMQLIFRRIAELSMSRGSSITVIRNLTQMMMKTDNFWT